MLLLCADTGPPRRHLRASAADPKRTLAAIVGDVMPQRAGTPSMLALARASSKDYAPVGPAELMDPATLPKHWQSVCRGMGIEFVTDDRSAMPD